MRIEFLYLTFFYKIYLFTDGTIRSIETKFDPMSTSQKIFHDKLDQIIENTKNNTEAAFNKRFDAVEKPIDGVKTDLMREMEVHFNGVEKRFDILGDQLKGIRDDIRANIKIKIGLAIFTYISVMSVVGFAMKDELFPTSSQN